MVDSSCFWGCCVMVSLFGDFGEVCLGCYKIVIKLYIEDFDLYLVIGLGDVMIVFSNVLGISVSIFLCVDNMVSYEMFKNLGGFYGVVDIVVGEGNNINKMQDVCLGYKNGLVYLLVVYFSIGVGIKYKVQSIVGLYDFSGIKFVLMYMIIKVGFVEIKVLIVVLIWSLG